MPDLAALAALVQEAMPGLVEIRRDLHAHPELGYEEQRTSGVIRRELEAAGVAHVGGLAGGTGVLAHLPGGDGAPIALRADIDALPIFEKTELPWASTIPNRMHACGHDGHTTMLLGVARALAKLSADGALPRSVTLFFQPAEEGGAGAAKLIEDGALDGSVIGPAIERIYGLHNYPGLPLGAVATKPGTIFAASDRFEIQVTGRGSHAAWPHESRDPVIAGAAIVTALQTIVSRSVAPTEPAVVSVTTFRSESDAFNVIGSGARLGGTVRTLSAESRDHVRARLTEIVAGTAAAHGVDAALDYDVGYPPAVNDADAVATFESIAREAIGDARVLRMPSPVMGGEDFAYYGHEVPACFFLLGTQPGSEPQPGLHEATFDFNDDAIPLGIEMFLRLAIGGAA